MISLAGKAALITGGSRGIGAAAVKLFAQAGADVIFNYVKAKDAALQVQQEAGKHGTRVEAFKADVSKHADNQKLVDHCIARLGRLDILVANHGVWPEQDVPIDRMTDEQWRSTLSINLDGVFGLVKHAVAQIKSQPRTKGPAGHIVLISSTSGQRGEAFHCDYSATKGAIISLTKSLSTELASAGIYVNCVAPGWVDTDMSAGALADPKSGDEIRRTIPLGRAGRPEEIAAPVLFLCTEHASFIAGEVFNVNGGAVLAG